jgi:hypothetical protein
MQTRELERAKAPWAWVAARDARQRSLAAQSHYTQAQQVAAERMRLVLECVYANRKTYVTYRQKFISVKVEAALVRDRRALREMETEWAQLGYEKLVTDQGVTYRIPRQ